MDRIAFFLLGIIVAAIFNINVSSIANLFYRIGDLIQQTPTPDLNQDF